MIFKKNFKRVNFKYLSQLNYWFVIDRAFLQTDLSKLFLLLSIKFFVSILKGKSKLNGSKQIV